NCQPGQGRHHAEPEFNTSEVRASACRTEKTSGPLRGLRRADVRDERGLVGADTETQSRPRPAAAATDERGDRGMTNFPAYATSFELQPKAGAAFQHLSRLISLLTRVDFVIRVENVAVNQGQMVSDFDSKLEQALQELGAA